MILAMQRYLGHLFDSFCRYNLDMSEQGLPRLTCGTQVSVADIEKYEFLVENIEGLSRYICRCRLLEKLYIGEGELHSDFQAAMVQLYGQILIYLARAKGYFDKQKVGQCHLDPIIQRLKLTKDLVRVVMSAFRDKTEFEAVMDKISKAFDDVNKSAALIRREGRFPTDFESSFLNRPATN